MGRARVPYPRVRNESGEPDVTIKRRNYGRGHGYFIDGVKADGVTTLIGDGVPKPALTAWAARVVAEHVADNLDAVAAMGPLGRDAIVSALKSLPWSDRNKAATKGTDVHELAAKLIDGSEIDVPDELAGYVEACVSFVDEWKVDPILVEATVANRMHRYAGTLDVVANVTDPTHPNQTRVAIIDYKTSASGIFAEVALQLGAYAHADVYLDGAGEEMPMSAISIGWGLAVWLRSDGSYEVYPVDVGPLVFHDFLAAAEVARMTKRLGDWLGEPIHV